MKTLWKKMWLVAKETVTHFMNDNVFKLSASLSYYTLFSLAPMLLLFLSIVGYFYGEEALRGELYGQIKGLVGADSASQIQEMVKKTELSGKTGLAAIVGIITLFVGATGVFVEIQDSINKIWSLKPKPKNGIVKYIINRFVSFSLLVSFGFLFIVSLLVNTALDAFSRRIEYLFSDSTAYILQGINMILVWIVMTILLAVIFSVLPDGKVARKDALVGASVTAILFMIGKWLIGLYLGQSSVGSAYGAAGSIVILLLWVNYSSLILFFGAEFTKVYATHYGKGIQPASYTVLIKEEEVSATATNAENLVKEQAAKAPGFAIEGTPQAVPTLQQEQNTNDTQKTEMNAYV